MTQSGQYYGESERRGSGARPQFNDMTVGDYANGMPSIRIGEMFRSLMRQMIWLIPLFLMGAIVAFIATKDVKRSYKGEGRILVQLGTEYTYDPVNGQSQQSLMLTPDIITLNEAGIMESQEVLQAVKTEIEKANLQQHFAPEIYAEIAAASNDPIASAKAQLKLHKMLEESFSVTPQPKSSIVNLAFEHENGPIAVEVTKFFMNAYMKQRQTIFVDGSADVISDRRKATEEQLRANEDAIQAFLTRNRISDFAAERSGATARLENLRAEINTLQAQIAESEAALSSVENQLRQTPGQINIYQDDTAGQRVAQAELELKSLLARYLPNSDPVRAKQAEIAQYKALQSTRPGEAIGGARRGANPVYQELMTRRNLLQSTADSYREKEFTLQRQLTASDKKVRLFQKLSPAYQTMLREQATLDQRHTSYTAKEQEALINQKQSDASSENVRVISWPDLPRKGRNMRAILTLLIMMGWGFTLVMIALLKVFLDPKLYSSRNQFGRRGNDGGAGNGSAPSGRERRGSRPDFAPTSYIPEPVAAAPLQQAPAKGGYAPKPYEPVPYDPGRGSFASAQPSVPVLGNVPSAEHY